MARAPDLLFSLPASPWMGNEKGLLDAAPVIGL